MRRFLMALSMALVPLALQADDTLVAKNVETQADTPLGKTIENFTLRDFRGKQLQLDDLKESRLVVVMFMGVDCPLVRLYGPRVDEMAKSYDKQDVAFIGINANKQDPPTRIGAFANKFEIDFPILKDPDNSVADAFGAIRTPEVFVLDENRVVRYWGGIDDQFGFTSGVGYSRQKPERHNLKEAIDEVLAGKTVSVATTKALDAISVESPRLIHMAR